jgi:hypothetical protein
LVDLFEYMKMHGLTNPKLNDTLYIYCTEASEKSAMDAEVPVSPFCAY